MNGTVIGIHPSSENKTPPISENDGAEVKEYIHAWGTHMRHVELLDLIEGKWLTVESWRKEAEQKLGMDETEFAEMREDLEASHCICSSETGDDLRRVENGDHYEGLVSAVKQELPVPPGWMCPDETRPPNAELISPNNGSYSSIRFEVEKPVASTR